MLRSVLLILCVFTRMALMRRPLFLAVLLVRPVSVSAQPQTLNNLLAQITTWDSTYMGYITGDLVKSGNSIFICVATPTNCIGPGKSPTDEASGWRSMAGVQAWNSTVSYAAGQMVTRTSNNSLFTALRPNTNEDPVGNPTVWQLKGVASVPTFVPANATSDQIQASINATPAGGVVQLDCATFTSVQITIDKALTLQGCGPGGMQGAAGVSPTQLIGISGNVILVSTIQGVVIRDLAISIAPASTGIGITTPGPVPNEGNINDRSIIERVWFNGGSYGIFTVDGRVRGTMMSHLYFSGQTIAGIRTGGVAHTVCNIPTETYPACSTGSHVDNCDGGGYTITSSIFEGNGSVNSDAMQFVNSAGVTLMGNQAIAWGRDVASFSQACFSPGPAPSQFQIVGNQFEAGIGRSAIRVSGQHVGWFLGSNYLSGLTGPAVFFSSSPSAQSFLVQLTGNQIRIFGFPSSTQPALSLNNVAGVSVTGNGITAGQNGTAPNGAVMTDVVQVSITGNTMGLGATVTNGFSITCTSGTSCVCAAGNNLGVTGSKFVGASDTGGC